MSAIDTIDVLLESAAPRFLAEADLKPAQGDRFQPTGFPDLGAATYTLANGRDMLLVESPQSVANRLEAICWDEVTQDLVPVLTGLPYVRVMHDGRYLTSSIQDFHRLNSPYILDSGDKSFLSQLQGRFPTGTLGEVNTRALARFVFEYDPNSILHGVFIPRSNIAGGRLRLQRAISGFIEAKDVRPAESGGVKFDRVDPSGDARRGFGHVPFHRMEYVAGAITAYFNVDVGLLRSYGFPRQATTLLIGLAFWKIAQFLESGLRLRTACDLDCIAFRVTRPEAFALPSLAELANALPDMIASCADVFADPRITEVQWQGSTKARTKPEEQVVTGGELDPDEDRM